MPHYKLVPVGRSPEFHTDEIILSRNEQTGEPEHVLSRHLAREIPEELLEGAHQIAARLGFRVDEAQPPSEEELQRPVGADTAGAAPVITQTGASTSEIDQQAAAEQPARASQQDTAGAPGSSATTASGSPATSATTNQPTT